MPSLLDPISESAKIMLVGDSGHGKTGAKASLIAAGYKLRMIDTDNGFKILRSLLTDRRYPYADYMKKHGIDPNKSISYIPIEVPIELKDVSVPTGRGGATMSHAILSPASGRAWRQALRLLNEWKDGENDFGDVNDWDNDTILDLDTLSTLAELAMFSIQEMNNRLGSLNDEHGRDNGAAQELIRRLMMKLTSPRIRANVILTTHITWVDQTAHAPQSPEARLRAGLSVNARGFPQAIGRASSPTLGKRWNDCFSIKRTGDGPSAERKIFTVPTDNVDAKNSVWLEPSYPISTGLAEIFAALRYQPPPEDLIKAIRGGAPSTGPQADAKNGPVGQRSGFGFGGV